MSGTLAAGSYADLMRRSDVARTFGLALVGRLAYGLLPLTLLFTVQRATDSFAQAAIAMALNGLAAFSMPWKSRLIDRLGQRVVVPMIAAAMVVVLATGAGLARAEVTSAVAWWALALAVGLASPPLGPCMRAQWRALVLHRDLATAYSLDAVCEETLYLLGPVLAAAMIGLVAPYVGLLLAAVLLAVGAAGLAISPVASRVHGLPKQSRGRGPLRHRRFRALLLVMAVVGAVTATIYTGTAARALAVGHPSYAGLADAGVALGSILGGLAWGRRRPSWSWGRSLTRLLAFLGAALLVAGVFGPYGLFALALAVAGLAISPIFVVAYGASDQLVDPAEVTEAGTWVNTVTNLGISFGGAASGLLVSHGGARAPVWAGAALALGCVIAAACRRRG